MTELEKSDWLESKLEIRQDSFAQYGLKIETISFADFETSDGKYYFHVNYEISRANPRRELFNEMCFAVYDQNGKIRESAGQYLDGAEFKKYCTNQMILGSALQFTSIGKIVIYMK